MDVRRGLSRYIIPGGNQNASRYAAGQRDYARIVSDSTHPVWKKLEDRIRRARPAMVGIAYITPLKHAVLRIANLVKGIDRDIKVIAGSFHPTFCPEEVMCHPEIDFVVRGEGEMPLLRLVQELKNDAPKPETVPGITYRDREGRVRSNPDGPLIEDLDTLPYPARDLVLDCDYRSYRLHFVSSARGCPYTCSFCSDRRLWHRRVRRRSAANVIEELKFLKEKYTPTCIDFSDGTFTFDRKYLQEFCKALIEENLNVSWRCTARFDNLDEEILYLMKQSGCSGLYFGLESGSDRILETMDKKMTVEKMTAISRLVHESGIASGISVLLGLPDETREDIEATLALMKTIKTDIFDVNTYIPIPGTPLYDAMSQTDRDNVDWLKTGYKSFDSHYSGNISSRDFDRCRKEAYRIAGSTLRKTLFRMGASKLFGVIPRMLGKREKVSGVDSNPSSGAIL